MPQVLRTVAFLEVRAVDQHAPAGRLIQAAEQVEQGAFAATGGTADRYHLPGKHFQVNSVQDGDGTVFVALPHILGAQ
jgi:hypothetical protein